MPDQVSPAVSVVMPVFNCEPYLRLAVRSVVNQTFGDFELIVVDDGSTDGSLSILQAFASRDPRVRVVSRPNTGIVGALNDGLALARGEFIARMDGDDVAEPRRFDRQVEFLRGRPDHVLVGSQVLIIDADGDPIGPKIDTQFTHEQIDGAHLHDGWPVVHPTVMMRRSAVDRVGGYRKRFEWLEDLDLFLRLAEVGRLANLPEILLRYRQHNASVCHVRAAQQAVLRQQIYDDVASRRGIPPPTHEPRRAGGASDVAHRQHHTWAWRALLAGNKRTARKYAVRAVCGRPLSVRAWKLLACVARDL